MIIEVLTEYLGPHSNTQFSHMILLLPPSLNVRCFYNHTHSSGVDGLQNGISNLLSQPFLNLKSSTEHFHYSESKKRKEKQRERERERERKREKERERERVGQLMNGQTSSKLLKSIHNQRGILLSTLQFC